MFLLFAFGMATHYALDVLLIHVSGGIVLLYPLSWETWQLQFVRPDNWLGTTMLVAAAILVLQRAEGPKLSASRTSGASDGRNEQRRLSSRSKRSCPHRNDRGGRHGQTHVS